MPMKEQHRSLNRKLSGHYAYFGITGNMRMLNRVYQLTRRIWCKMAAPTNEGKSRHDLGAIRGLDQDLLPAGNASHRSLLQVAKPSSEEPDALCGEPRYVAKSL